MNNQSLEQYIKATLHKNTVSRYLYEINNFLQTNPQAPFYSYSDIVKYFEGISYRYANVATRNRILSSIKQYYNYLVLSGRRNDHPCKTFYIKQKKSQIQTQDLFSMEEMQLLMTRPNRYKNLEVRNKVIISLLIYQGLTSDEITKLNISNVDLDNGVIHIKASAKISARTLELHITQISFLYTYIHEIRLHSPYSENCNRLLLGKQGGGITIDGIFTVIEPLKGLFPDRTLNPEKIRLSVISHWLNERKLPVEQVMDLSGQKWPSSVMMYKKINIEEQQMLINKFHPFR